MFRRIRLFLLSLTMIVAFLPLAVLNVFALSEVKTITASSDLADIMKNGNALQFVSYTKNESNDIVLDVGYWEKRIGGEFKQVSSGSFTPGEWKYTFMATVLSSSDYRFATDVTFTSDGKNYSHETEVAEETGEGEPYWYIWFTSPVFTVKNDGVLSFAAPLEWDYIQSEAGQPIEAFSVASGVSGGSAPYTFSKVSGPDWISVSADGTVSGTPVSAGLNSPLEIRVTDNNGDYRDILLNVDETTDGSYTYVDTVAGTTSLGTGDLSDIMSYGAAIPALSINVTSGAEYGVTFNQGHWMVYDGTDWVYASETEFQGGDYLYEAQFDINAPDSFANWFASDLEVTVNGVPWTCSYLLNDASLCTALFRSPPVTVDDPRTPIYKVVSETDDFDKPGYAPHYGDAMPIPYFNVTWGTPAYVQSTMTQWKRKKNDSWNYVSGSEPFGSGTYVLETQLRIDGADSALYYFTNDLAFENNGNAWNRNGRPFNLDGYSYSMVCSREFHVPMHRVSVSGVTPPTDGAVPTIEGISVDLPEASIDKFNTYWAVEDGSDWKANGTAPFAAGKKYAIQVTLNQDAAYEAFFADTTTVYVNGVAATASKYADGSIYVTVPMEFVTASTDLYVVTASALNVRSGASADSLRVGGLKYGDVVQAKGRSGKWVLIEFEGKDAWVNGDYLALTYTKETAIKPINATVTAGAINVREQPDKSSTRIGGYTGSKVVLVTGEVTVGDETWLVVDYDGQLGFINAKYTDYVSAEQILKAIEIVISELPEDIFDKTSIEYTKIAQGDTVAISEEDMMKNDDGTWTAGFFPDDAMNFMDLTKDSVRLPEGCGYDVLDTVLNADGSIAIVLGKKPVKVTFETNGGSAVDPVFVTPGSPVSKPAPPLKEGYSSFDKWYKDPAFSEEFDFTSPVSEAMTLYYHWAANMTSIEMYAEGTAVNPDDDYTLNVMKLDPLFESLSEPVTLTVSPLYEDASHTKTLKEKPVKGTTYWFWIDMEANGIEEKGLSDVWFAYDIVTGSSLEAAEADIEIIELSHSPGGTKASLYCRYTEKEIVYIFESGGSSSWTKGSGKTIDFTVKRNINDAKTYALFTGIEVDGKPLSTTDYTAANGSLKGSLKASFLATLKEGKHTLSVQFTDGTAETEFTIKAAPKVPDTSDRNNTPLWIGLTVAALAVAGFVLYRRNR